MSKVDHRNKVLPFLLWGALFTFKQTEQNMLKPESMFFNFQKIHIKQKK